MLTFNSYIFVLSLHVIAKHINLIVVKKLLVDDKKSAFAKQILGVTCKVLNRKALSGETFCFLEKCLLSIFLCFE